MGEEKRRTLAGAARRSRAGAARPPGFAVLKIRLRKQPLGLFSPDQSKPPFRLSACGRSGHSARGG